tara:strand:- start:6396 stop:7097 length:702 start_codon:yes stop_codon:yes gene_type:complete
MKVAIMQPYFFPYIGYFQLINSVDKFIIYDNIQYTRRGWINRNRILNNNNDKIITLPIKKGHQIDLINFRHLADTWEFDKIKMLRLIKNSYNKSPNFKTIFPIITSCLESPHNNLFDFILNSLHLLLSYLRINTEIIKSSDVNIDHTLKSQDKIIAICKKLNTTTYINAEGGQKLYNINDFNNKGIKLKFIKSLPIKYKQFNNEFIPWLSIIDVLMFNKRQDIILYLNKYTLI